MNNGKICKNVGELVEYLSTLPLDTWIGQEFWYVYTGNDVIISGEEIIKHASAVMFDYADDDQRVSE